MTAPPAVTGTGYPILPVYVVLDLAVPGTSGDAAMAAVLPTVRDAWARQPTLSDKLRLAMADTAAGAQVRLPLCDPLDPDVAPPILSRGGPPTGAALATVRAAVEADARALHADGFAARRPLVCLILGSAPDDSWRAGLGALSVSVTAPVVVLCCLGPAGAEAQDMAEAAVGAAVVAVYTADPALPADAAVGALTDVLTTILVRTGHALGPAGSIVLPANDELPPGVTEVPARAG